jgi:hypothetical protein
MVISLMAEPGDEGGEVEGQNDPIQVTPRRRPGNAR